MKTNICLYRSYKKKFDFVLGNQLVKKILSSCKQSGHDTWLKRFPNFADPKNEISFNTKNYNDANDSNEVFTFHVFIRNE